MNTWLEMSRLFFDRNNMSRDGKENNNKLNVIIKKYISYVEQQEE